MLEEKKTRRRWSGRGISRRRQDQPERWPAIDSLIARDALPAAQYAPRSDLSACPLHRSGSEAEGESL